MSRRSRRPSTVPVTTAPRHDEPGDAELSLAGIGGGVHHQDVRDGSVGDETLGAVEHPAVALATSGADHREHVRPRGGFGGAVPGDEGTIEQAGKPSTLLLRGAESHDRNHSRPEMGVDREQQPEVVDQPAERLHDHDRGQETDPSSSILIGNRKAKDPRLGTGVPSLSPEDPVAIPFDSGSRQTFPGHGLDLASQFDDVFREFHRSIPERVLDSTIFGRRD